MHSYALTTGQAKTVGIWAIVGLVVIGVVLSLIISAIIGRLIVAAVVIALAAFVWTERDAISGAAKKCDATFFGVHLTPSNPTLKQTCAQVSRQ